MPANTPPNPDGSEREARDATPSDAEREALAIMRRAIIRESTGHCCPTVDELRVGIEAGGFRRDADREAEIERLKDEAAISDHVARERWRARCDAEARLDLAIRERDEARAERDAYRSRLLRDGEGHAKAMGDFADLLAKERAERNALAAKLATLERDYEDKVVAANVRVLQAEIANRTEQRDAAIARAEAAEADAKVWHGAHGRAATRADAAEARANALAEALRKIASSPVWQHHVTINGVGSERWSCDGCREKISASRTALAANADTTDGEGT